MTSGKVKACKDFYHPSENCPKFEPFEYFVTTDLSIERRVITLGQCYDIFVGCVEIRASWNYRHLDKL